MSMLFDFQTPALSVGEIVAADIRAAEVFKRLGIDFCCNGKRTLFEACVRANVSLKTVIEALQQIPAENQLPSEKFDSWDLGFLADYVLNVHHRYLYENLPFIDELMVKVVTKHGDRYPTLLLVQQAFQSLKADLLLHLQKEEIALFPFIHKVVDAGKAGTLPFDGQALSLKSPIDCMEHEHEYAGSLLFQIQEFTDKYTPPGRRL